MAILHALLVGITDYKGGSNKLPFCESDVELMGECLTNKGFTCTPLVDCNLDEIPPHLGRMASDAKGEQDVILFYFSGHGMEVLGEQFLVGKDANLENIAHAVNGDKELLRLSAVLDQISHSQALKLVVVDACRSSVILKEDEIAELGLQPSDQRRKAFQQISHCVIAYSCADGQKSRGRRGGNSHFTVALATALKEYGCDFVRAVQESIASLRNRETQTPWFYASTYSGLVPDRLSVAESTVGVSNSPSPHRFIGLSDGKVRALASDRLLEFDGKRWKRAEVVFNLGKPAFAAFAENVLCFAVARRRTIYVSESNVPASSELFMRRLGDSGLKRVFGVTLTSSGDTVAAYGEAAKQAPGLAWWSRDSSGKWTRQSVSGLPAIQCNAVCEQENGILYASFSKLDGKESYVQAVGLATIPAYNHTCRITAMRLVTPDLLVVGDINGEIFEIDTSNGNRRSLARRHALDMSSSGFTAKGWVGANGDHLERSAAVLDLQVDHCLNVLAISYYDQTLAFVDLKSWTFIATLRASHFPRQQAITRAQDGGFMALRGIRGTLFRFEAC